MCCPSANIPQPNRKTFVFWWTFSVRTVPRLRIKRGKPNLSQPTCSCMTTSCFQFLEESMPSLSFKLIKICIEIGGIELAEFRISLDYQIDRSIIWLFRESSAVGLPAPVRLPPASCPLLFFIPLGLPPALSSVDTSIFACGLSVLL